jgi:hypothetical protein
MNWDHSARMIYVMCEECLQNVDVLQSCFYYVLETSSKNFIVVLMMMMMMMMINITCADTYQKAWMNWRGWLWSSSQM